MFLEGALPSMLTPGAAAFGSACVAGQPGTGTAGASEAEGVAWWLENCKTDAFFGEESLQNAALLS